MTKSIITTKISAMVLAMVMILSLTACKKSFSYTFNVSTGEQIKIKLDTTTGYKLKQSEGTFTVETKDGKVLTKGMFLKEGYADQYFNNIAESDEATVIEQNSESLFYSYQENGETIWNYVIKVPGAKAGVALTNKVSEDSAKEIKGLLTISLEKEE